MDQKLTSLLLSPEADAVATLSVDGAVAYLCGDKRVFLRLVEIARLSSSNPRRNY